MYVCCYLWELFESNSSCKCARLSVVQGCYVLHEKKEGLFCLSLIILTPDKDTLNNQLGITGVHNRTSIPTINYTWLHYKHLHLMQCLIPNQTLMHGIPWISIIMNDRNHACSYYLR